jgi:hypothetical protein
MKWLPLARYAVLCILALGVWVNVGLGKVDGERAERVTWVLLAGAGVLSLPDVRRLTGGPPAGGGGDNGNAEKR